MENVFGDALSSGDVSMLEDALAQYLSSENVSTYDVMVTSTCQSKTGKFCSDETGSEPRPKKAIPDGTSTWDVSFLVTAVAEEQGVDGTKYTRVVDFSERVGRSITRGVLSGSLQRVIHTIAEQSPTLAWVHLKKEQPTKLMHINYVSTAPPSVAPLADVIADEGSGLSLHAEVVTVVVDDSDMQYLMVFAIAGVPVLVLAAFLVYQRSSPVEDTVLGVKQSEWETVVFNEIDAPAGESALQSSSRGARAYDSATVAGRSPTLPYPSDSSFSKHSSHRKESGSAVSVDALLEIPGRAPRQPVAEVPNSDSSRVSESRRAVESSILPVVRQQAPLAAAAASGPSRLPQAGGVQRDRFRVREGLDHHDLSLSSVRSGLKEVRLFDKSFDSFYTHVFLQSCLLLPSGQNCSVNIKYA